MASSLDEVARQAGVSPATVSRALRGVGRVSEATRARVVSAAAALDYVISPAASSLARGTTGTVGVVVPYVERWFFATLISAAERVLREAGISVLLYNVGDQEGRARFFHELPLRRRVDAVLVLSLPLSASEVDLLRDLAVPVVTVGLDAPGTDCVGIDDHAAATSAMRHLLHLGHRDIAFIGEDTPVPLGFTTPLRRRDAYRDALHEAGIADGALEVPGGFTIDGGERAMTRLLSGHRLPTAVFVASDEMAFGALRALRRAGLRPGRDISLIGFDDHDLADVLDLSTVAQPVLEQGKAAAQILLRRVRGDPDEPSRTVLDTHLVLRGSTAPQREAAGEHD
ncbi:LacI family DNA-binding transcriptional regulator [Amycolatopsis sp. Hca4]|uniref:LacI family DNA-binding transcriptional regulator n=1 Tax=Amycolatopsis sp. Hca4 TaxID=2742131 RepID=UPI0020CAB901|nr:LacI family DNA-binding transcriptional regulator [Amycolatopsis sp. Hca4]